MNDKPVIIVALAAALIALTFPFWRQIIAGRPTPPPRAGEPQYELPSGDECVAKDMRANHMQVLNEWRDAVVRGEGGEDGEDPAAPVTVGGVEYPKSLTRGCMACHTSNDKFCARCHEYADVDPNCWDCHVEPNDVVPLAGANEE